MGSGAAGTYCVAASEGDCVSSGSHNDRFHGPEPVPGWLRASSCEDSLTSPSLGRFASGRRCCGLRMSRHAWVVGVGRCRGLGDGACRFAYAETYAGRQISDDAVAKRCDAACHVCLDMRNFPDASGGPSVVCLSCRLRMSWHAYLSGYVMSSARRRDHQRSAPPRRSCRTATGSPARSAGNQAVQNSVEYDCCRPRQPRTCRRA